MVGIFIIVCCCRCCLVALDSLVILLLLPLLLLRDLRRFVGHDKYTKTFSGFFQFFALFSPLPHSPPCCLLFVHSLCAGGGRRTKCQARPGQATTRSQLLLPLSQQFKTQFARCSLLLLLLLLQLIGTQSREAAAHPQQIFQVRSKQL